jgi:hypothetical protein
MHTLKVQTENSKAESQTVNPKSEIGNKSETRREKSKKVKQQ